MATTTVSDAIVFPQSTGTGLSGNTDQADAVLFAALGQYVGGEYINQELLESLQFKNHDGTNDTVDIGPGVCYITDDSGSTSGDRSGSGNPQGESSDSSGFDFEFADHSYVVILPTAVTVSCSDSVLNQVWINITDISSNNAVEIRTDGGGGTTSQPSDTFLKLGEVNPDDASQDTRANPGAALDTRLVDTDALNSADLDNAVADTVPIAQGDGTLSMETMGGVTYVQSTESSSPSEGETWLDTDNGIYRAYADLGSGLAWQPIPSIQVLEEVSTFTESNINLTTNNTIVNNGSLELGQNVTTESVPGDNGEYTTVTDGRGFQINPNYDFTSIEFTLSSYTEKADHGFVVDSNENILAESTAEKVGGETYSLTLDMTAGTNYYVGIWEQDTDIAIGYNPFTSFPTSKTAFDIQSGFTGGHPNDGQSLADDSDGWALSSITGTGPVFSGDAVVNFTNGVPDPIESWDLATFRRTFDGETVTIDIEDGSGNVLFSDIDQNFDISTVDTSKEVRFRANLSRNDSTNNPTTDYLARRFTR